MNHRTSILVLACVAISPSFVARAQSGDLPFAIAINEVSWAGPPLQSYAVAQTSDGKWLCLCGRTAGLHGLNQATRSNFDRLNDRIYVVDVNGRRTTSRALTDLLPKDVAAALTVTGPQFVQVKEKLYIVGGYGSSPPGPGTSFMMTYAALTVVDVPAAVQAVLDGKGLDRAIRQSAPNEYLRVTGGELEYFDGTFLLILGQKFETAYTPQSSGTYTHQLRPFQINEPATGPVSITRLTPVGSQATDPQFRRRDLNAVSLINPSGKRALAVYGGVFTSLVQGPWYQPIYIGVEGGKVAFCLDTTEFRQQLCQYNCAVLPIYQAAKKSMCTLFFGGISEVYYTSNGFERDTTGLPYANLPFVDHVSCITRFEDGSSRECLVCQEGTCNPLRLPGLLGTGARFLPSPQAAALYDDGVLALDSLKGDTAVGYIYGGIAASRGTGGPTQATGRIFEVHASPNRSSCLLVPSALSGAVRPSPQGTRP